MTRRLDHGTAWMFLAALLALSSTNCTDAATIFESGTLGQTGVTWSDLTNQTVPGTNISQFAYNGVRFDLTKPANTTAIGGHFVASTSGTFFGAIISLDDENDFPNSGDFSTPDVLGHAMLTFPTSSAEVFGDLELSLDPGWYCACLWQRSIRSYDRWGSGMQRRRYRKPNVYRTPTFLGLWLGRLGPILPQAPFCG